MDSSDEPVGVGATTCSCVVFIRKRCRNKPSKPKFDISVTDNLSPVIEGYESSNPEPKSAPAIVIDEGYESAKHISKTEIAAATHNFSPKFCLGEGTSSTVYKGHLHNNNLVVAIKRLNREYTRSRLREFRAEVEALCSLRHQNVVPFLGYCVSGGDRFLVYKFMERGSLYEWLHRHRPLSWETRIKILKDVAQGLWYMHDGLKAPMIHRDIKPSNILLDKYFKARLTDFGLARTIDTGGSHVSTEVNGSLGYMPPEYDAGIGIATLKADVYSFGVSMLETMTRKLPFRPIEMDKGKQSMRFVKWVRSMATKKMYMEMLDPSIPKEDLDGAQVGKCFRIAVLCVSESSIERPTMGKVVDLLNRIPLS